MMNGGLKLAIRLAAGFVFAASARIIRVVDSDRCCEQGFPLLISF
jgi:hypothetical protein